MNITSIAGVISPVATGICQLCSKKGSVSDDGPTDYDGSQNRKIKRNATGIRELEDEIMKLKVYLGDVIDAENVKIK